MSGGLPRNGRYVLHSVRVAKQTLISREASNHLVKNVLLLLHLHVIRPSSMFPRRKGHISEYESRLPHFSPHDFTSPDLPLIGSELWILDGGSWNCNWDAETYCRQNDQIHIDKNHGFIGFHIHLAFPHETLLRNLQL